MVTRTVNYYGFEFPYVRLDVQQDPEYAEGGFTQIGTTYTLSMSGHLVGTSAADFNAKQSAMRAALQTPRCALTVSHGDGASTETLFSFGAGHDDDWGPLPGRLWFSNQAANSCRYQWSVKCYRKEKWSGTTVSDSQLILSLSRRYSFGIDVNGMTTRTISGRLFVSSRGTPADQFRDKCCPDCPAWYQRTQQQFDQSEDGRTLTFSVTDVEKYWTLPETIMDGQASFRVHMENNAVLRYSLSGWFSVGIDQPKWVIIDHILNLVEQKIPSDAYFDTYDLTDELYDNKVQFTISAQKGGVLNSDVLDSISGFGERPAGTTGSSAVAGPYGGHGDENSGVMAGDVMLYDAAGVPQQIPDWSETPPNQQADVDSSNITDPTWNPTSSSPNITDEQKNSPYISYHDVVSYECDHRLAVYAPKSNNYAATPVMQQTSAPVLHVVQAGYAVRLAACNSDQYLPQAPRPILGDKRAMRQWYISPASEEPVNEAYSRYTVHWRYVMVRPLPTNDNTQPYIYVPPTPVRLTAAQMADSNNFRVLGLPTGILDAVES